MLPPPPAMSPPMYDASEGAAAALDGAAGFAVLTTSKLQADRERWLNSRRVENQLHEPRAEGTERRFDADVTARPQPTELTPLLDKVLAELGSICVPGGVKVERLSAPRINLVHGSEAVVVRDPAGDRRFLPQQTTEQEETTSREMDDAGLPQFVMKAGDKDGILLEVRNMRWARSILGRTRVPRDLLAEPRIHYGHAAFAQELLRFAPRHTLGCYRLSSLADLLALGVGKFGLEDVRCAWGSALPPPSHAPLHESLERLQLEAEPPDTAELRWVARQVAEVINVLMKQKVGPPPSNSTTDPVTASLFNLVPLLERHVLQAHHYTTSPLHPGVLELTMQRYLAYFGRKLTAVLEDVERLRARLSELCSAQRTGATVLPRFSVPLVLSHGRLSVHHLLFNQCPGGGGALASGGATRNFELRVTSWSELAPAPLYSDLATLMTSIALEAVRLPVLLEDVVVPYQTMAEVGASPSAALCAYHLRVSERTVTRLFLAMLNRELTASLEGSVAAAPLPHVRDEAEALQAGMLMSFVADATASHGTGEPAPETDPAWLASWLRCACASVAASSREAMKMSDALCDWTLPSRSVSAGTGARSRPVPRPGPPLSQRQRDEVPIRAMQWGRQAIREFREAGAATLPLVEGDVADVWPVLWLVPALRFSLELLDAADCPWSQKLWVLHHVGGLAERLLRWLDGLTKTQPKSLSLRLAEVVS